MSATGRRAVLLIVMVATGASDLLASQFSLRAMACCARTHQECAGLRTPDDCCQGMAQGLGAIVTTPPDARAVDAGPVLAILPIIGELTPDLVHAPPPSAAFKRPHDPPHLHPVALLI